MKTVELRLFLDQPDVWKFRLIAENQLVGERVVDLQGLHEISASAFQDPVSVGSQLYRWLDGDTDRWLSAALDTTEPVALHVDCSEAAIRTMPWELLAQGNEPLASDPLRPFTPVYRVRESGHAEVPAANRPLRVLFMACSPRDVTPVLDFEREEAAMLDTGTQSQIEITVEESGSLNGLQEKLVEAGEGYFDVVHINGHAGISENSPVFVAENDYGERSDASSAELAACFQGLWPQLVFLSGCTTGGAAERGAVPSMAEYLVHAGAPAVLGWAEPVGDLAAIQLAQFLYGHLASGLAVDEACARARQELMSEAAHNARQYGQLLRLYSDGTPLSGLVTPSGTTGRARIAVPETSDSFLDADGISRVASKDGFVGRRREIQRCLRSLRSDGTDVLVIHGMGGLGKSTLTSRLLDRMISSHQQVVWVGQLDEPKIIQGLNRLVLSDIAITIQMNEIMQQDAPLATRLSYVLSQPLRDTPVLFVFDDFEFRNLDDPGGIPVMTPQSAEIVNAFAAAIRSTNSASRLVIASRYDFAQNAVNRVAREHLGSLNPADAGKKVSRTMNLRAGSSTDRALRERAIETAAGIPRLIEWLDLVVGDPALNHGQVIDALAEKAVQFRTDVLAEQLLESLGDDGKRHLALAAIYEIPVPVEAMIALTSDVEASKNMARASQVGLIESSPGPGQEVDRFYVSPVVRPLLLDVLDAEEQEQAVRVAAKTLHSIWIRGDDG